MEHTTKTNSKPIALFSSIWNKLSGKGMVTCKEAYMQAKYNKNCSTEEILKLFIEETNNLIKSKMHSSQYCAIVELGDDILPYKEHIKDLFANKLGFGVALLDQTLLKSIATSNFGLSTEYLVITWKHPDDIIIEDPVKVLDSSI